ncbi:LytR/AlgR family response regulator transcription factor [Pseudorhodoferax sp.]|uniref:LytR/AlgR family response regulator transcription factor n=1 Tax=Pseudorhodoferax sp. TaxID=1993553 RepID=UPI002DD66D4F|nr:LytTR family DNA-binding domain-containing protein [Pseudorhodoferax sp.]
MTPTALIAEDEPLLATALQAELKALWPALHLLPVQGDGRSALATALAEQPALCFLDIRMPAMTGLEVAAALAEDWPDDGPPFPLLVFVTAYDQYALQAFDAQAVDYLVKPVQHERLARCVQRLQQRLAARAPALQPTAAAPATASPGDPQLAATLAQLRALLAAPAAAAPPPRLDVIQAQAGAVVHLVPIDQVLYFEAADKYLRVVTAEREHLIRLSLRELLPQLDPQRYWQVHRGTVVQARAIASARREDSGKVTLTLHGRPEKLVASRLYAHLFKGL